MTEIGKVKTLEEFLTDPRTQEHSAHGEKHSSLFTWTGHPFVDAGLVALLLLSGKEKPEELTEEDVENAIKFASELYAKNEWSTSYIHAMIMPNNGIILANPGTTAPISNAIKKAVKKDNGIPSNPETLHELNMKIQEKFDEQLAEDIVGFIKSLGKIDYKTLDELAKKIVSLVLKQPFVTAALKRRIQRNLWELFGEIKTPNIKDAQESICAICGRHPVYTKKERYRSVFPLLGTGDVPNYFPLGNTMGEYICAHCLFLAQMMPLIAYRLSRVLVIHAYPYELMLEFHREALDDVRKTELASVARNFRRPENFLFEKLIEIGTRLETGKLENASITLYYFVNNNQGQEVDVIYIPNSVLRFVAFAARVDRNGWSNIVAMGWRRRPSRDEVEEFKRRYPNDVYARLLSGKSILPYFIDPHRRRANSKWRLLSFYCSEVLGLDRDALEFVKGVADRIVETVEKLPDNKLSKRVRELERAEKLYQFEGFFIRVERDRQELGIPSALMGFDDFARILTSYGEDLNVSWKTVKNLLLFRIYEKLHDRLMKASEEAGEPEEEEFEEGEE